MSKTFPQDPRIGCVSSPLSQDFRDSSRYLSKNSHELRTAALTGEWVSQLFGIDNLTDRESSEPLCS